MTRREKLDQGVRRSASAGASTDKTRLDARRRRMDRPPRARSAARRRRILEGYVVVADFVPDAANAAML